MSLTLNTATCSWVSDDKLYRDYHDFEWGVPCKESAKLFEMLCLEGQQAGLSWITVLKKRAHYQQCFHGFDPQRVAAMDEQDIERLLQDKGLIRHRGKLTAIINNAQAYLRMQQNGEDFATFVWQFVGNQPQINQFHAHQVPAKTEVSDALSKALKKRGFKFIGSTVCYAFMQSCGLVNDHQTQCFCHSKN